jgi:nucleotide-binding universal stress UspA family protein
MEDSIEELKELENAFANKGAGFRPAVTCVSDDGQLSLVINKAVTAQNVGIVVMGTHGNTGLSNFMLGNHSRRMIDDAICPLLLIPANAPVRDIKKVAFATDFKEPEKDLKAIFELIPMLKKLNAELLLTHIYDESDKAFDLKTRIEDFLAHLSNKANYPYIYYRIVKSEKPEKGLDWLCQFGNIDVLAMVHRKHSFFYQIFTGSHTQKMAGHISIPLLVIPEK